jgi:hypothetical protein
VIVVFEQATLQFAMLPVITSAVHAFPSSHVAGHVAVGSQVSPGSTVPSGQVVEQSASVAEVQPAGQQPSLSAHTAIAVNEHTVSHVATLPPSVSVVQALPSSQLVTQPVLGSQVSPGSSTPLSQMAGQSVSVNASPPGGQQPSPSKGAVMSPCVHSVRQAEPLSVSVVHASASSQLVGQAPALPPAMPVSQSSTAFTTPSPQANVQSFRQVSSSEVLPSSHSSGGSTMMLPHVVGGAESVPTAESVPGGAESVPGGAESVPGVVPESVPPLSPQ